MIQNEGDRTEKVPEKYSEQETDTETGERCLEMPGDPTNWSRPILVKLVFSVDV